VIKPTACFTATASVAGGCQKAVHTSLNYIIIIHVFAWCEAHIRQAKRASSETNRESN